MSLLGNPAELVDYIRAHAASVTAPSWDNQAEYCKLYASQ